MKADILAFGAHPDDVELAAAGTVIKHVKQGLKVVMVDLTRGELGTRGSAELRDKEAAASSVVLGISARVNLNLGDGFFEISQHELIKVIEQIRYYKPEIVLANAKSDRHPDHGRGGDLVSRACFLAGLSKVKTIYNKEEQDCWRPKAIYHYIQDYFLQPDLVVDITGHEAQKMEAIRCFSSQFHNPSSQEPQTPISSPEFMLHISAREIQMGRYIGVKSGEGFTVERPVGTSNLLQFM